MSEPAPLLHYLSEGELARRLGLDRERLQAIRQALEPLAAVPEHLKRAPDLQFMSAAQVSERLAISAWTLKELRRSGKGPRFLKNGQRVLYHTASVIDWAEARLRSSTS